MARPTDIRLSFNEVVDVYDEVRPGYPAELFDSLFEDLPAQPEILEVGPGTGQATKDLIAHGARVHAIEIGPALAARLRANLSTDRLRVSVGDFEQLDIPAASVDAVFSANAYHWISPGSQTDRPARILRPGGVIAIVEVTQVQSPADFGFFSAAQPIYNRYGQQHKGPPSPARDQVQPPFRSALEADRRFDHIKIRRYDWDQTFSAAVFRKLTMSVSSTQMMTDADRTRLLDDLEALVRLKFDGQVTRPQVVTLTTAVLAPGVEA